MEAYKGITALLVEDEPDAVESMRILLATFCPNVQLLDVCDTIASAQASVLELQPDIIFLDINLRGENGFELLKTPELPKRSKVIFTTAYSEFAIKAIRNEAHDYLLKPIDPDELRNSINRFEEQRTQDKQVFAGVFKLLESSVITQDDWLTFKENYEEQFHDFFHNLMHKHPELTENDLRLAALVHLKLEIKEIARMLGISPDGAKKAKYRLRKRLALEGRSTLESYLLLF